MGNFKHPPKKRIQLPTKLHLFKTVAIHRSLSSTPSAVFLTVFFLRPHQTIESSADRLQHLSALSKAPAYPLTLSLPKPVIASSPHNHPNPKLAYVCDFSALLYPVRKTNLHLHQLDLRPHPTPTPEQGSANIIFPTLSTPLSLKHRKKKKLSPIRSDPESPHRTWQGVGGPRGKRLRRLAREPWFSAFRLPYSELGAHSGDFGADVGRHTKSK